MGLKNVTLNFEVVVKKATATVAREDDYVLFSKNIKKCVDEHKEKGFELQGIKEHDGRYWHIFGFCNKCKVLILDDWKEENPFGAPGGLRQEDGKYWCSKCYFKKLK